MVVRKAKSLAKEKKQINLYANIKEFKFSEAWLEEFINRYNFVIRKKIHIA